MTNRVYYLPPEVHRRLLILDPPRKDRRVAFTDLNEVRTFKQTDSPSAISGKSENELLKEHIRRLERRLERLSPAKENRQMQSLKPVTPYSVEFPTETYSPSTPPVTPRTDVSATSPFHPQGNTLQALQQTPPPANVQNALAATPVNLPQPQVPSRQQPAREKPASKMKMFLLGVGVLSSWGVIPALVSIVALGPAAIGLAAGLGALSAGAFWLAGKID